MRVVLLRILVGACLLSAWRANVRAENPSNDKAGAGSVTASTRSDWIRTGETRYGWKWLAARYDMDRNATVTREEFPANSEFFARLDRSWDGALTEEDFDWSKDGVLCRQKETAFALFKSVDGNSDGRIAMDEWQAVLKKIADEKGYLNAEDLERLMYLPRVVKTANEEKLRTSRSEFSPERLTKSRNQVPQPGEMAPDFELRSPDGLTTVRLSSFRGKKPVVLAFGCFSCGNYRTYTESLEELYKQRKNDVEFLRVYVREAHPVSAGQAATPTNSTAGILIPQPATFDERCSIAKRFVSSMQVSSPVVVDDIDNSVGQRYGGTPDRLYVVDREGRIAFTGGPGPFGFNPREMEQTLLMVLMEQQKRTGQ